MISVVLSTEFMKSIKKDYLTRVLSVLKSLITCAMSLLSLLFFLTVFLKAELIFFSYGILSVILALLIYDFVKSKDF